MWVGGGGEEKANAIRLENSVSKAFKTTAYSNSIHYDHTEFTLQYFVMKCNCIKKKVIPFYRTKLDFKKV